jgi:hypothetical protein
LSEKPAIIIELKSGAPLPKANNVTPATFGESFKYFDMVSKGGTK